MSSSTGGNPVATVTGSNGIVVGNGDPGTLNMSGGTLQASGDFTAAQPMTLTGEGGNANLDTAGTRSA